MIKINETDALWKYYKRYYQMEHVPHPQSICNYFWKALGGFGKSMLFDWSIYIWLVVWAGVFWGLGELALKSTGVSTNFLVLAFIFLLILCLYHIGSRIPESERKYKYASISGIIIIFLVSGLVFLPLYITEGINWKVFLFCYLTEIGAIILMIGFLMLISFLFEENNKFRLFLKSMKDRVCPLVEPPEEWKKAEFERKTNCGDG